MNYLAIALFYPEIALLVRLVFSWETVQILQPQSTSLMAKPVGVAELCSCRGIMLILVVGELSSCFWLDCLWSCDCGKSQMLNCLEIL